MTDAERLQRFLELRGMNVRQLAKGSGIPATTIYSIINRNASIKLDNAYKMAFALGIEPKEICSKYNHEVSLPEIECDQAFKRMVSIYIDSSKELQKEAEGLLDGYYRLNDEAREELLDLLRIKLKRNIDKKREQVVKKYKG